MASQDIPLEDIVLLQLFKDNLLSSSSVEETPALSEVSTASTDSDLSDLDSVLSQQFEPDWPSHTDLPSTKRKKADMLGDIVTTKRLGKDEKLAKEAQIPFTVKTLVSLPMDEFNDLLSKTDLTEDQLNTCRDIRRRGKNKVAAQNCRQRKLEQIEELQLRYEAAVERRSKARYEHSRLLSEYSQVAERLKHLSEAVLTHFNKDQVNFTIQVSGEEVNIMPRTEVKEEYQAGQDQFPFSINTSISSVGQYHMYDRKHYQHYF